VELKEAQRESDDYAHLLSDLISIKSHKYTIPSLKGYEATNLTGQIHVQGSLTLRWDVEGAPANLKGFNVTYISSSTRPHIKGHISYLAKSIVLRYEDFIDHSIIESFKIIEESNSFPSYYKYFALRNVLAHSPVYFQNTIKYFNEYFDEKSFDYLRYEPEKRIIILNHHSAKTRKKLRTILQELLGDIETYLNLL
jgi:hypothetical protein